MDDDLYNEALKLHSNVSDVMEIEYVELAQMIFFSYLIHLYLILNRQP